MNQIGFKEIAIIGTTACGKTSLAIKIAMQTNSVILSLDSLSVYKEINIASAKPTINDMSGILHFGIDEIMPNEISNVMNFMDYYKKAKNYAKKNNRNLILVGGTGFYLKSIINGLSTMPTISLQDKDFINEKLKNLQEAYEFMYNLDSHYMSKIKSNDRYRIEKALTIYKSSCLTPTEYFQKNTRNAINNNIKIFQLEESKEILNQNIVLRTNNMIKNGLIDEIIYLEKKYTRLPICMGSIGIKETLMYLDGILNKIELKEKIVLNTIRLAKMQRTFNKSQFANKTNINKENIYKYILNYFK